MINNMYICTMKLTYFNEILSLKVLGEDDETRTVSTDITNTVLEDLDDIINEEGAGEEEGNEEEGAGGEEGNEEEGAGGEEGNEEEGNEEATLIEELVTTSGYAFENETFDDSVEGILSFAEKIAEKKAEEIIQNTLKEQEQKKPQIIKEFESFVTAGNNPKSFFTESLYDVVDVTLDASNLNQLKNVIKKDLELKNFPANRIEKIIDLYEKEGELYEEATLSLTSLTEHKEKTNKEQAQLAALKEENAIKDANNFISKIKDITEKGNLNEFVVPQKERETFFKYVTVPVKNNFTQHELDLQAEPLEVDLQMAYLRFKKLNLDAIVKTKANTDKVKSLKDRIAKTKNTNSNTARTKNLIEDIDYNQI